ncbi:MAG: hypothetical protein WB608_25445 [Terracidiphilus sp.]
MNNPEPHSSSNEGKENPEPDMQTGAADESSQGPNLVLLYSILALALLVAISLAVFIVLPFYHRR